MKTFSISTLGCKVNQYEGQAIREFLEGLGLSAVEPNERPELVVINTCCVTATASAKSRQYIQRAGKLSPDAIRVVCGCLPAMKSREMTLSGGNNVHIISSRDDLPAALTQIVIGESPSIKAENGVGINDGGAGFAEFPRLPLLTSFKGHTRAFLKVQDGCDGLCTYCIVPKVRPNVHSKPIDEVVAEAKQLVAAGHKEIVITGVNLGAYGRETVRKSEHRIPSRGEPMCSPECRMQKTEQRTPMESGNIERPTSNNEKLTDLLEELARIPGLMRIRVSSLEPGDISEELLDVFCAHPNIMPHIHLSVQSGSDNVLRKMGRQYGSAELREKIALIKSRLDRPAITSDIIVGFPTETEEDFEQTAELARWAGFSKIHVFPFSVRMGTPAAKLKGRVAPGVIKERSEILRKLSDDLGRKFREQFVGETCEVLLEDTQPISGRCERYFVVYVDPLLPNRGDHLSGTGKKIRNELVRVRLTGNGNDGATGEASG
jgi:threonylcarbamoyladenosine tRNA methylthiotransferase MtaB